VARQLADRDPGPPTAGDEPGAHDVAAVVAWFAKRGHHLDLFRGRDGSHRAAFRVNERVRHFGIGASPLEAARQAMAMFAERASQRAPRD
jgi:hypothetical protein